MAADTKQQVAFGRLLEAAKVAARVIDQRKHPGVNRILTEAIAQVERC